MTSLEHRITVAPSSNRSPSWTADRDTDVETDAEEVSARMAPPTTTTNEEAAGEARKEDRGRVDGADGEQGPCVDGGDDCARGGDTRPVQSALGSRSHSHSRSRSGSGSNSRSQSSVREGMDVGESSAATSWTHVGDGVGGRPSGDPECRPDDVDCRSSGEPSKTKASEVVDVDEGKGEDGEDGRGEGIEVVASLHPRTGTGMDVRSGAEGMSRTEEVLVVQEEDIGEEWHPSRYDGKARLQEDGMDEEEKTEGEGEEDVGSRHAASIRNDSRATEEEEKERWRTFGSSGRNSRHLRLEFQSSSSPQPWDDADLPTDNNEVYASDYYSTLTSKKFETLQKSRRRPLIPHSSYYFGPPPPGSAYCTPPVGQIGIHHPREVIRIERDYAGGEVIQFTPVFPLELEGRITPTQFHQTINDINEILISAYSIQHACIDNLLAIFTLQLSTLVTTSHYTKEMRRLKRKIEEQNTRLFNLVGLNILWPQKVAFLFLEIEYY